MKKLKRYSLLSFFLLSAIIFKGYGQEGNSPPCHEVKEVKIATDSLRARILFEFIKESERNGSFSSAYDKGVVHLHEYQNKQGELCWLLIPIIDDRYKDNPPSKFSDFNGDIILLYEANSEGHPLQTPGNTASLNQCLEQIIGDRVFSRPVKRQRWTSSVLPITNKKRYEGNRRLKAGNGGSLIIIFDKNGGYRKTLPV